MTTASINLFRLVYFSRSVAPVQAQVAQAQAIASYARLHNAENQISGLLLRANGFYLQVLEGDEAAVNALYQRICADPRHTAVTLLARGRTDARAFGAWAMGMVDRTEATSLTEARMEALSQRLCKDPNLSTSDFFRLLLAPSLPMTSSTVQPNGPRSGQNLSAAFISSNGRWGAAVIQHIAALSLTRSSRTNLVGPEDPAQRTLIEYVDVDTPEFGPLRAMSLDWESASCMPVAPLIERLQLLVFVLAPSELALFEARALAWFTTLRVLGCQPKILLATRVPVATLLPLVNALGRTSAFEIDVANVKLSDAPALWTAARRLLPHPASARPSGATSKWQREQSVQDPSTAAVKAAAAAMEPAAPVHEPAQSSQAAAPGRR